MFLWIFCEWKFHELRYYGADLIIIMYTCTGTCMYSVVTKCPITLFKQTHYVYFVTHTSNMQQQDAKCI